MPQPTRRDFLRGAALLSLSAGAMLASGCSDDRGGETGTKPAPTSTPTIPAQYQKYPSILTNQSSGDSVSFWGWDTLKFNKPIEDYVAAVAGVTTTGRQIPNDDLQTQLKLGVQGGKLPDVFKSGTGNIPTLAQIGAAQDLTDLVAPYRKYLPDFGWNQVTFKDKIYGIPVNSPAGGMFYRRDVLDTYKIDPGTLTTWDAFIEAAKQLSSASNGKVHLFGYQKALSVGMQIPCINLNHAQLLNENMEVQVSPDKPEWQKTMSLIRSLFEPGVGKEVPEWSPEWFQAMKDGTLAAIPSGTWFLQTIVQQAPDTKGKWTFLPFPAMEDGGDRYVDFGSAIICISSKTKKREAAFELVKAWSIDPEGAVGIGLEKLGISVVSTAALESDYVNKPQEYFADEQPYWRDATEAYNKITWSQPITTASAQALGVFGTDLADFYAGGDTNQFLTKVASDLRTQIKGVK